MMQSRRLATQPETGSNSLPAGSPLGLSASSSETTSWIAALSFSPRSRPFRDPARARSCAFSSSRLCCSSGAAPELSALVADSRSTGADLGAEALHVWRARRGARLRGLSVSVAGLSVGQLGHAACLLTSRDMHGAGHRWKVGAGSIFR